MMLYSNSRRIINREPIWREIQKMTKENLKYPVILFASIEREQHDALRALSYKKHRSIAALTRDAIEAYISGGKKSSRQ